MKRLVVGMSLLVILSNLPAYSANLPKAGLTCSKQGVTKTHQGKKFTCIKSGKKLVWSKGVVVAKKSPYATPTPTPSPSPTPTLSPSTNSSRWIPRDNPVTAAIQRRIGTLWFGKSSTLQFEIFVESSVPTEALESLRLQQQYLAEAFPEGSNGKRVKYFLYDTVAWGKQKAAENNCRFPDNLASFPSPPTTMIAGATRCPGSGSEEVEVTFINWPSFALHDQVDKRLPTGADMFAFIAAQESGGGLLQNHYNKSKALLNWEPVPAWYAQGGQFTLSSIALAVQTREWRQSSLNRGFVYVCKSKGIPVNLKETSFYDATGDASGCYYPLGAIATELMVALYGFESQLSWYEALYLPGNVTREATIKAWEETFPKVFGDSLESFYEMTDAYAKYLDSQGSVKLPESLLTRLSGIGR